MAVNTRWVDVPSENGKMAVFVAEPAEPGYYPGLAYFHIVLGANEQHRSIAERLASEGYVVAMPDLYHRLGYRTEFRWPEEREQATAARGTQTDYGLAVDSRMALNLLRELPNVDPSRLGTIGYCGGGTVALLAGCVHSDVQAVVSNYGPIASLDTTPAHPVPILRLLESLNCPVLSISGGADQRPSPADIKVAAATMEKLGKSFEYHIWEGDPPAGHAFFDADIPDRHNAAAVEWAWPIKLDFLRRNLKETTVATSA